MKYFIDLGAYDGDTITKFLNKDIIDRKDIKEFEIYAFEPQKYMCDDIELKFNDNKKVHVVCKCAWVADGIEPMSIVAPDGATICTNSTNYQGERHPTHTVDFSKFIKDLPDKKYVIVKFDIEGAEFDVLDKMIKDGTDKMVDYFLIEYHDWLFANRSDYEKRILNINKKLKGKMSIYL